MSPKITGELLRQLRQAMRNCKYFSEPIQAYIVPSGDAHQVSAITNITYIYCICLLQGHSRAAATPAYFTWFWSWLTSDRLVWPSQLIVALCPLVLPFPSPYTWCDVRGAAKVALKMSDWWMATSRWLLMKLISLPLSVPVSFRVSTSHRVTAGVNSYADLMALQVGFACVTGARCLQFMYRSLFSCEKI